MAGTGTDSGPLSELCHFSWVGGQPPCLLEMALRSPSAPVKHTLYPARHWGSGLITHRQGQFMTSTHGSSAHTEDLSSRLSPCLRSPQTASPYGHAFAASKHLKTPSIGARPLRAGGEGGQLRGERPNQTPPDSVRPSSS